VGFYEVSLTVPANTPEDAPVERALKIEGDVVTLAQVDFPYGCAHLVRAAFFYGIKQLWPSETGTWFRGTGTTKGGKVLWDMPEPKVTLTLRGWSEDDTYDHELIFSIITEPAPAARPWKVLADFIAILKQLIGV